MKKINKIIAPFLLMVPLLMINQFSFAENPAKVNINSATMEELITLPGIGESTAKSIVDFRETNGGFSSAEDIMKVSGVGEKKYEKIKDLITVGSS